MNKRRPSSNAPSAAFHQKRVRQSGATIYPSFVHTRKRTTAHFPTTGAEESNYHGPFSRGHESQSLAERDQHAQ
jgi:hypothetical protein